MSLSPLVSFKSRFVTYLLNFPRIMVFRQHEIILKPSKLISNIQKCSVRISWSWNS